MIYSLVEIGFRTYSGVNDCLIVDTVTTHECFSFGKLDHTCTSRHETDGNKWTLVYIYIYMYT